MGDPEIQQVRGWRCKVKKWLIGVLILAVLVGSAYLVWGLTARATGPEEASEASPELPVVKASSDVIADAVVVPARSVKLSLPTSGVVAELLVAEGDVVEAGQALLRLNARRQEAGVAQAAAQLRRAQSRLDELEGGPRPQEVDIARAAVEAAQAQLARVQQGARPEEIAAAEAALTGAEANLLRLKEGPSEAELVAARADQANAEASVQQAQAAYDRVKGSADIQMRPEALALEQATNASRAAAARLKALGEGPSAADLAAARAQVQEAQAQRDALRAPARAAELAAAEADIRRAQGQLDLLEAGARSETLVAAEADVRAAEAALEQAQVALSDTELRAPFGGTVAALDVKADEQVMAGNPIVWLADFSEWQVETDDLTELNVVRVREGSPVSVTLDALPGVTLAGEVLRIRAIGENKMGDITYTVVIRLKEHDPRLRWNLTASVVITPE